MVGPGESAAPPQERLVRLSPGKFARPGRHGGGPAGRARRLSPQGRTGCSASPGRPAGVEGREPPSGTARSARLLPLSGSEARGTRPSPAAAAARALRGSRALGRILRPGAGAERFPGAWVRVGAWQPTGAHSPRRGGAQVIASGRTAWLAVAPGPKTSPSLLSSPWLRRRQQQRPRLRARLSQRCQLVEAR